MTTSEQTFSLLSVRPVCVNGVQPIYYWQGIAMVQSLTLALAGSYIFKMPMSPEIREIAGRNQRLAIQNNVILDQQIYEVDKIYGEHNPDTDCFYSYSAELCRRIPDRNIFDNYSISEILSWFRNGEYQ